MKPRSGRSRAQPVPIDRPSRARQGDPGSIRTGLSGVPRTSQGARRYPVTMTDDRPYVEHNHQQLERLRALVEGLDDEALAAAVNEYWTVAGVLGHMAYWDSRFLVLAQKIDRGEPWVSGDQEPDGDWLNDSTRPLLHAIPPRAAAELALRMAEETDARAAELPLDRLWPGDPESPISPARGEHRGEHLDEIEAALRPRG